MYPRLRIIKFNFIFLKQIILKIKANSCKLDKFRAKFNVKKF